MIANSVSIGASDSVGQDQGVQRPILRKRQKDPYVWPEEQIDSHEDKKWKIKDKRDKKQGIKRGRNQGRRERRWDRKNEDRHRDKRSRR